MIGVMMLNGQVKIMTEPEAVDWARATYARKGLAWDAKEVYIRSHLNADPETTERIIREASE